MHIMSSLASPSSIVDCMLVLGSCCSSRSTCVGQSTSTGLAAWWLAERNVSLFSRHLCRVNSNRWQNGLGYPVYIMSVLPSKCKDNIKTSIHKHQTHARTQIRARKKHAQTVLEDIYQNIYPVSLNHSHLRIDLPHLDQHITRCNDVFCVLPCNFIWSFCLPYI